MKVFQHSQGFVISFGFDMMRRKPNKRLICWCDPVSEEWETKATNQAGCFQTTFSVAPEFVFECDGRIIAYQPGKCIEMTLIGLPYIWQVRTLQSDQDNPLVAAA